MREGFRFTRVESRDSKRPREWAKVGRSRADFRVVFRDFRCVVGDQSWLENADHFV